MQHLKTRRLVVAGSLLAAAVALKLVVLPAAAGTGDNRLQLEIVANNPGPLTTCSESGTGCGQDENTVWHFIYVRNTNALGHPGGTTRATLPNSFVVSRIDITTFVDGEETYNFFYTPPPDTNFRPYSGHWPATVTCPPEGPPCNVVGSPAVIPGERTAILYAGWSHGDEEPNGLYVFRFTVHGTLNGEPVDLTASSQPIRMID